MNFFKREKVDDRAGELILEKLKGRLSDRDSELLEGPFTVEEVVRAINGLARGKSPGEDGLSSEFYSSHSEILAPILTGL